MKIAETKVEHEMKRALLRELSRHHAYRIVPNRVDTIKKTWLLSRNKEQARMLEGRLDQNVYSGDITISFRRFTVKLGG